MPQKTHLPRSYLKKDCDLRMFRGATLTNVMIFTLENDFKVKDQKCSQVQCNLEGMWKETGAFKEQPCWTYFPHLFLCDWFKLPSYRYCISAGIQSQMETTSVHCTWTSEKKDSISLKLRLTLSKTWNCARESDLKQSDFPKLSFFSAVFCSSENL